jgi:dipeptidyl aminopeptidase/acylaminoacyl peptidase
VPITDLKLWAEQNGNYRPHVFACCGGDPEEMAKRSPVSYIDTIAKANVKIFHGKYDDCVPVSHSLELYSAINEKYPGSRVFLDIFDGGHQIDMALAMGWILSQYGNGNMKKITG